MLCAYACLLCAVCCALCGEEGTKGPVLWGGCLGWKRTVRQRWAALLSSIYRYSTTLHNKLVIQMISSGSRRGLLSALAYGASVDCKCPVSVAGGDLDEIYIAIGPIPEASPGASRTGDNHAQRRLPDVLDMP